VGNRVVLQGTNGTVVVGDLDFRNAFGFRRTDLRSSPSIDEHRIRATLIPWRI
jgi:predicted N-acetyltransferase YhbS